MKTKDILGLLKETWNEWNEDKAPRLGAALAYYTVFSLAPLLIIVIAIAGFAFGQRAVQEAVIGQVRGLVGEQGAELIQSAIQSAQHPTQGIIATVISAVTLLLGALGVFGALQDALNTIWEVAPRPGLSIMQQIRLRFMPLSLVLGTGFLLLVSLVVSAILAAVGTYFGALLPLPAFVFEIINFIFSLAIISLLFALIFKFLPDAHIAWRDVWVGAIITSLLFVIGKMLIGLYLGNASVGSIYGTAGSLVVLLVWIYYSAQILFLGAEFTQVYANKFGSHIRPAAHAIPLTEPMRAEQGMTRTEPRRAPRSAVAKRTPSPSEREPAVMIPPSQGETEPQRRRTRADGPKALLAVAVGAVVLYLAGRIAGPRSDADAPTRSE